MAIAAIATGISQLAMELIRLGDLLLGCMEYHGIRHSWEIDGQCLKKRLGSSLGFTKLITVTYCNYNYIDHFFALLNRLRTNLGSEASGNEGW